jgi:hypothetical protein
VNEIFDEAANLGDQKRNPVRMASAHPVSRPKGGKVKSPLGVSKDNIPPQDYNTTGSGKKSKLSKSEKKSTIQSDDEAVPQHKVISSEAAAARIQSAHHGKRKDDKVLITGDDILIEYVSRVIPALKEVGEGRLRPEHMT